MLFSSTLAETVPRIYRDLERAIAEAYPDEDGAEPVAVPPLLSFGSWIGGDRDGNPFVTPRMTVQALELMREQCLRLPGGRPRAARRAAVAVGSPDRRRDGLTPIIDRGERAFPELAATLAQLNPEEPYRRALTFMRERVRATQARATGGYDAPAELLEDLRAVQRSLREESGADRRRRPERRHPSGGGVRLPLRPAGHPPARQRPSHGAARGLRAARVCDDYAGLADDERESAAATSDRRSSPAGTADIEHFTPPTREAIETFRMLRETLAGANRDTTRPTSCPAPRRPRTCSRCCC